MHPETEKKTRTFERKSRGKSEENTGGRIPESEMLFDEDISTSSKRHESSHFGNRKEVPSIPTPGMRPNMYLDLEGRHPKAGSANGRQLEQMTKPGHCHVQPKESTANLLLL